MLRFSFDRGFSCKILLQILSLELLFICMDREAYFNSNGEWAMPHVVPSDGNGGFQESSSSSISPKKEAYASPLDLPLSIVKMAELGSNLASGDVYSTLLDKFMNTGSGVGMSSSVADANLMLPSGAFLHRSGNAVMEPYLNLPSSPKSFLSCNLSNLAMDGSRVPQQNSVVDHNSRQGCKRQQVQKIGVSASLIESELQSHQFSFAIGMKQESNTAIQMLKKPRIDVNHNVTQEQIVQQLLLRQDIKQLQDNTPQLRALIQHHRQQILDPLPQFHGVQAQQSEQQFRDHLQQQATCPASSVHSSNDGVCSQRLMQCLGNLKNQPQDKGIDFWRKIASEFYAPCAKERWCLPSYQNVGQHALGILSLGAVGAWCCHVCGSRSGKGFEASFEVLPRLWKIKFESGVLEEILFLDFPQERSLPSGVMLLEYEKAVQQSVYEQFRVVHEGKLRVIFRHDLKILSWEFCASHHDEYFLRPLIAPQVNQLICVAQQYQNMLSEGAPDKVSVEKLQASCDMFAKAGNQFTKSLQLPTVNESGFSKRYVRCLQIAEVLNIMKDLMTFSHDQKIGPIESLHAYHQQGTVRETRGSIKTEEEQETSQQGIIHSVLTDGNRSISTHAGLGSHFNDTGTTGDRVVSNPRAGDMELLVDNYYQKILRKSLFNPRGTTTKPDKLNLMDAANRRAISSSYLGQSSTNPGLFDNSLLSSLPSQSSEASKNIQQHRIDKLLQNALGRWKEQAFCETSGNIFSGLPTRAGGTDMLSNGPVLGNSITDALGQANHFGNVRGNAETSSVTSNSNSLKAAGSNIRIKRDTDMTEFHLPETFQGMDGQ